MTQDDFKLRALADPYALRSVCGYVRAKAKVWRRARACDPGNSRCARPTRTTRKEAVEEEDCFWAC